jgi:hypothetical protein
MAPLSRTAVVQYLRKGEWRTAVEQTSIGRGIYRNDRLEFTGPKRLRDAYAAGKRYAGENPAEQVRMVEIVTTLWETFNPPSPALAEGDKDVHTERCCSVHGCKYGEDYQDCPVTSLRKPQSFPCEACEDD